jgi:hypothetical protein
MIETVVGEQAGQCIRDHLIGQDARRTGRIEGLGNHCEPLGARVPHSHDYIGVRTKPFLGIPQGNDRHTANLATGSRRRPIDDGHRWGAYSAQRRSQPAPEGSRTVDDERCATTGLASLQQFCNPPHVRVEVPTGPS